MLKLLVIEVMAGLYQRDVL